MGAASPSHQQYQTRPELAHKCVLSAVYAHDAQRSVLSHLVLEHFPGVTEAEIQRIVELARQRWDLQSARVVHRVGAIAVGQDIVLLETASKYRLAAYEANVFIMDYLKTEASFCKQECFGDGTAQWVAAKASDQDISAALGLEPQHIQLLEPYITILPQDTRLNIYTASERVLAAALPLEEAQPAAARQVSVRNLSPFKDIATASALFGDRVSLIETQVGVQSQYFLVSGKLRLEGINVYDRYILHREGQRLRTVRHECNNPAWQMELDRRG